ncbi:hypothetical protein [Legionella cherrii]|uniref:hypothetical protein n=1 Tax=Legionella cherrii TaxID=28084 RepID=UPI00072EF54A|nr:hypothetical protein [Legionella cherrii]
MWLIFKLDIPPPGISITKTSRGFISTPAELHESSIPALLRIFLMRQHSHEIVDLSEAAVRLIALY